jgi:hypothetical protein
MFDYGKAALIAAMLCVAAAPRIMFGEGGMNWWEGLAISLLIFPPIAGFGWPLCQRVSRAWSGRGASQVRYRE